MKSAGKAAMDRIIIFSIAAVYIVQQLTHLEMLKLVVGCLVLVAIVLLLPNLKGVTFWLTVSFMVAGTILMFIQKVEASLWFESAGINVTIVTLFIFAPLFGIPVRIPEYVEAQRYS
ncbi:hypothetical protein [Paenibacillus whitsoniae]|uniref:Uncharacterized protein n=1 Tax=Paenibacillus whitsoniae TaxID=2496558 RepID=A0A430JBI2_9BACL|nr:hypothetical protein [Paenibacillus whitsoniae]RTE08375.1 hypothetical protein EJQ19_18315 [Paenibacillus whitsoniae]